MFSFYVDQIIGLFDKAFQLWIHDKHFKRILSKFSETVLLTYNFCECVVIKCNLFQRYTLLLFKIPQYRYLNCKNTEGAPLSGLVKVVETTDTISVSIEQPHVYVTTCVTVAERSEH